MYSVGSWEWKVWGLFVVSVCLRSIALRFAILMVFLNGLIVFLLILFCLLFN